MEERPVDAEVTVRSLYCLGFFWGCCLRSNDLNATAEVNVSGLSLPSRQQCCSSSAPSLSFILHVPFFLFFSSTLVSVSLAVTLPRLLSYSCKRNLRGIWPCLCNLCEMGLIIHPCDLICIVRTGKWTYERGNLRKLFSDSKLRAKFLKAFKTTLHCCTSLIFVLMAAALFENLTLLYFLLNLWPKHFLFSQSKQM